MATSNYPFNKSRITQNGFTLTELVMALAIGTILLTIAIPAFSVMLNENRMATRIYKFITNINYARSTAISRGKQVVFCKSADGLSCDNDVEWGDGWIIFIDTTWDFQRNDDEILLRVESPPDSIGTIDYTAFGSDDYVAFQPSGMLRVGNGTFTFCSSDHDIDPRAVIISKTGRVRIAREKPDGTPLVCQD